DYYDTNPLEGVEIRSVVQPEGQVELFGVTDSNGIFVFRDIRWGQYNFSLRKSGFEEGVASVDIEPGIAGLYYGLEEILHRGNIKLSVTDLDGNPLVMAQITSNLEPTGQDALNSYTDSQGTCVFNSVLEGSYTLEINKPGYITEYVTFLVSKDETYNLVLELEEPLFTFEVRVKDSDSNPIEGVQIQSVVAPLGQESLNGLTDSFGKVIFKDVKGGSYTLFFTKSGYKDIFVGIVVESDSLSWVHELERALGDIKLVVESENSPISDATIVMISLPEEQNNITKSTNSDGIGVFSNVFIGDYEFKITKKGFTSQTIGVTCILNEETKLTVILEEPEIDNSQGISSFPLVSIFLGIAVIFVFQKQRAHINYGYP
ncbi:collagen binding domain-containing protein, partial [Thermoproteota archaeon]